MLNTRDEDKHAQANGGKTLRRANEKVAECWNPDGLFNGSQKRLSCKKSTQDFDSWRVFTWVGTTVKHSGPSVWASDGTIGEQRCGVGQNVMALLS